MDFFSVLTMLGGIAFFLYGMKVMGGGLEKMAGGKLERILENMTSTKLKAVGLGAGVTAVIQSSSATTVMVIGFVNSGIMRLKQAIGVIFGAKIGTTITAWILSLAGISSDNFLVKFFKPSSFSPLFAAVGIYLFMFSKSEKKKDIGTICIGFAILMFGMMTMSGAMSPLSDMPEFKAALTYFSNPILALVVGVFLTALLQSSSASIGITQAVSMTGALNFSAAVPLIIGQNIGACVTTLLASIGTSKNAKRAAAAHIISSSIGAAAVMAVFYGLNAVFRFEFLQTAVNPVTIAFVHTAFNVIIVTCLLPCIGLIEKLVCRVIKDEETQEQADMYAAEFAMLDEKFLATPSYAIMKAKEKAVDMAKLCEQALDGSMQVLQSYDKALVDEIIELESRIDRYEDVIGAYLLKITSTNISNKDNMIVSMLLHSIGDLERISDHAVNIVEAAEEMHEKNAQFSDDAREELKIYSAAVMEIVNRAVTVFEQDDAEKAREVEPLEDVIDGLNVKVKNRHIKRLTNGECTIEMGFILSDITTNFERVADHCSNIAVYVMQLTDEDMEKHGYIDTLNKDDDEEFKEMFRAYKEKYKLPKH